MRSSKTRTRPCRCRVMRKGEKSPTKSLSAVVHMISSASAPRSFKSIRALPVARFVVVVDRQSEFKTRPSRYSTGDAVVRNQLLYKTSSDLRTKPRTLIAVLFDYPHTPISNLRWTPTLTLIPGLNAVLHLPSSSPPPNRFIPQPCTRCHPFITHQGRPRHHSRLKPRGRVGVHWELVRKLRQSEIRQRKEDRT